MQVERLNQAVSEEASPELLSFDLGDSDVSLFLKGSWKGTLTGSWGLSHSDLGLQAASVDSPILFAQEADMTLSLWLRERWFLETSFLDDYDLNTYRAGYQGKDGEAIQYVGVGNTGLDYPLFPYLDLGGDSAYSFGAYGRFGIGSWTLHSMFRYDAAAREERIFVGNRERTYSQVSPDRILRGRSFVLPQENISAAPVVYLEDKAGDLWDNSGRRWRKALPGEYGVSARYGLLELAAEPKGMVAVWYPGADADPGSYSAKTGFLGEVQDYFDSTRIDIKLEEYPQPGGTGKPGIAVINGINALIIYEPGSFSPFERQNRYSAPASSSAQAVLATASTGERISGFEVLPLTDTLVSANLPLLPVPETQRGIYELVNLASSSNPRDAQTRWPLIGSPAIYLPGGGKFNQDLTLRFTNYGPAGVYDIGTDVVPGSVEVFRGGLSDPNISYNAGSGVVQLKNPVGPSEIIRITYLKRSEETRLGSLAAGIGAVYNPGGPFSSGLGIGVRWNVAGESFSEESASSPGTVGLGARADWRFERLKTGLTLGLGFEQSDTTGLYRIAGMEGNSEIVLSVSSSSGFISETPKGYEKDKRADLVYRNYRNTDILGSTSLMPIDWSGSTFVSDKDGPYPVKDSVYNEVFTAEPEDLDGDVKTWTGFQVPLGSDGELLERARQLIVPFRFYGSPPPAGTVKLVVQFGSMADKDTPASENPDLIVERVLFDFTDTPSGEWETSKGKLYLTDTDRRKLQGARYMRFLIISNTASVPFSGKILVGKPVLYGASWRPITVSGGEIKTAPDTNAAGSVSLAELSDTGLRSKYPDMINRLHPESARQQVLEVRWEDMIGSEAAGADGRAAAIPLENYRVLSFFLKTPKTDLHNTQFRFILGRGPDSLKQEQELALDVRIPGTALASLPGGEWTKVEVRYGAGERRVSVNGWEGSGSQYVQYRQDALRKNSGEQADGYGTSGQAAYMAAFLTPTGAATLQAGSFSIDELILEDAVSFYRTNAGGSAEWTQPGTLASYGNIPVLEDLSIRTALETGLRGEPFIPETDGFAGLESRSNGSIRFLGAQLEGDLTLAVSTDDNNWSAGHVVSRSWGPFSFRESFSDSPLDNAMLHGFGLDLATTLYTNMKSNITYEDEKLERQWQAALGINDSPAFPLGFSMGSSAKWTENSIGRLLSNYGETWVQSWPDMVIDPGSGASKREAEALFKTNLATAPLGLELSLEGISNVTKATLITQSETRGRLEFPLSLGSYRLRFREERYFRRNLRYAGMDISDDLSKYTEALEDSLPLWYAIPLYALYDPDWGTGITRAQEKSDSADLFDAGIFTDRSAITLYLPEHFGLSSLFLPREIDAGITRTLEKKLDTPFDMLSYGTSLSFSSLNIFGALGTVPLFTFYQTDEFRHTLIAVVNVPKNESLSWRFQDELGLDFFGFSGAVLSLSNTITADTTGSSYGILDGFTLEWTVPAKKTLLGLLYDWYCGKVQNSPNWPALSRMAEMEYERLRQESLELVIDTTAEDPKLSVILGHESIIRILGRLSLSAFEKLNVTHDAGTDILSFIATIGTTLNISF
ncbi:hypothetical protein [Treponema primitia]|uniref:hypothetical protein n=1 Tax=Treponema primitia TaxID=88058 RepID=UPI0002555773|nr:hypothetical protein [Treponema primitia]